MAYGEDGLWGKQVLKRGAVLRPWGQPQYSTRGCGAAPTQKLLHIHASKESMSSSLSHLKGGCISVLGMASLYNMPIQRVRVCFME